MPIFPVTYSQFKISQLLSYMYEHRTFTSCENWSLFAPWVQERTTKVASRMQWVNFYSQKCVHTYNQGFLCLHKSPPHKQLSYMTNQFLWWLGTCTWFHVSGNVLILVWWLLGAPWVGTCSFWTLHTHVKYAWIYVELLSCICMLPWKKEPMIISIWLQRKEEGCVSTVSVVVKAESLACTI